MTMTGLGIIQDDIARFIEIDDKTLRKHYRRELDTGAIEANMRVAGSLFTMATQDKVPAAAIFWLKARMGWKETQDLNVAGSYVIETGVPRRDGSIITGVPRANGLIIDQETD
jgi:hypothetical protein